MPNDDALILAGARTPIGRYGGSLSHIRTDDLLGLALSACLRARRRRARPGEGDRRRLRERGA